VGDQFVVDGDPFLTALDDVERAGRAACAAIEIASKEVASLGTARTRGEPLEAIVEEGVARGIRARRIAAADAFHEYERSVARVRAFVVRALLDDAGLTRTDVARLIGISRQEVARLYERNAQRSTVLD
jgi:hypothetical protein